MEHQRTLTLDEFAAIAAQIDAGIPRDQVLAQAGVTLAAWASSQALWLERLAERVASGRYALTARYAELFEKHRRLAGLRIYGERKPLEGPLPLPPAPVAPPLIVMDRLVRGFAPFLGSSRSQPAAGPPTQADPVPTTLTVEEFAMLQAELAVSPEVNHPPIRERYGLDAASWLREEAAWHDVLTVDDRLRQRYVAHFQYMRGLMATSGRGA